MNKIKPSSLDSIEIRGDSKEEVRGLLRLLPEDTFEYLDDFKKGLLECDEKYCGQIGIYAKKEPLLGEKGVLLVVINEHLFGDPTTPEYNPILKIPEGAKNIYLIPPRQHPLKKSHPFAGVEFDYKEAHFFFGYELSEGAYFAILENLQTKKI